MKIIRSKEFKPTKA